jgi:hypothetical protein
MRRIAASRGGTRAAEDTTSRQAGLKLRQLRVGPGKNTLGNVTLCMTTKTCLFLNIGYKTFFNNRL